MPPRTLEAVSVVSKNSYKKNTKSLRLTLPQIIATFAEIRPGDHVRWTVETATGRITLSKEPEK